MMIKSVPCSQVDKVVPLENCEDYVARCYFFDANTHFDMATYCNLTNCWHLFALLLPCLNL
jgi:hypothetical protein